ncbi:MAG: aspartate aminotransferase [Anaerolinea sp.]|nr:aspartate aminotransferase [Anaerolinea sp.]
MKIAKFATEHFFAKYEFTTPYQLCNSDCDTLSVDELLKMAGVPLADFGKLSLGYTESLGNLPLRESIAAGYKYIMAEDVIFLGSPIEGIYLAARAILEAGDEVIALSPAYDALVNMFEHVVGSENVRKWRFKPTSTQWELDFEELESLINDRTKLIVVNFPHNPTGFVPTQAQLDQLVTSVYSHNLFLFCDEMYFGLAHQGTPSIPSVAELSPRAVVLSGLSKTYGLPGLRSGWLIVQDKALRDEIINWKFYTSICPPAPTEFLTVAALKVKEKLRDRSLAQIEANLKLADDFFARWPQLFTWRRPLAGSTALVEMHVPSVEVFAEKMAREAGVLIQPATTLGWDDQHFRLGLGRSAFGVALQKFEEYITSRRDAEGAEKNYIIKKF